MAFQIERKKFLAECFGTFCLVFAETGAIVTNDVSGGAVPHAGIVLTFGLVVLAMIYAGGDISGAHLNQSPSDSLQQGVSAVGSLCHHR